MVTLSSETTVASGLVGLTALAGNTTATFTVNTNPVSIMATPSGTATFKGSQSATVMVLPLRRTIVPRIELGECARESSIPMEL